MMCFVEVLAPLSVHSLGNYREIKDAVNDIGLKKLKRQRAEDLTILRVSFHGIPPSIIKD